MICEKCGFDMPAECCVIGNYWDCTRCKALEVPYEGELNFSFRSDASMPEGTIRWDSSTILPKGAEVVSWSSEALQFTAPPNNAPAPAVCYGKSPIQELLKDQMDNIMDYTVARLEESLWADRGPVTTVSDAEAVLDMYKGKVWIDES